MNDLDSLIVQSERKRKRIRECVHGGNATGSTALMLRTIAKDPSIKWPLEGGLYASHLIERANYLESAMIIINEIDGQW